MLARSGLGSLSGEEATMRLLRYSINVTLDGCVHHEAGLGPDEESMAFWTESIASADAVLYGRTTYEMMESAWRRPPDGVWPSWMGASEIPFAEALDGARKYVVSSTLAEVDWNAGLVRGDLATAVAELKRQPGGPLSLGGVTLPLALADLGLIDEYVFVVHPIVAGRGPTLLSALRSPLHLDLVERRPFASGAVLHRFRPRG
jgi:dihydrofolate reductase